MDTELLLRLAVFTLHEHRPNIKESKHYITYTVAHHATVKSQIQQIWTYIHRAHQHQLSAVSTGEFYFRTKFFLGKMKCTGLSYVCNISTQ